MLSVSINLNGMTKAEFLRFFDTCFYRAAFALVLLERHQSHIWAIGKRSQKLFCGEFTAIVDDDDRQLKVME